MAMEKLKHFGHPIVAVGKKAGEAHGTEIRTDRPDVEGIDTITLYVNAQNQKEFYDYIISLKPKRIIFNPGTENTELVEKATSAGIECIEACTLVMLSTHQY